MHRHFDDTFKKVDDAGYATAAGPVELGRVFTKRLYAKRSRPPVSPGQWHQ